MNPLSFQSFDKIYQASVREVYKYWTPQMQEEIAAHCYGWNPGLFDFRTYLQSSSVRFYKAYCSFTERGSEQSVCDIGGFWGVFPITLKSLGFNVTMTESLQYYSDSFSDLFKFIVDNGVTILDHDPFKPKSPPPGSFDFITVMAVLEHYPHSLKHFMENIISMLNEDGRLYIEVPNIAYWPKRIKLIRGRTPLVQIKEIYESKVPFIGHHHEFTIFELRDLAEVSDLKIIKEIYYNYSQQENIFKRLLMHPLETFAYFIAPDTRECIAILCKKKHQ